MNTQSLILAILNFCDATGYEIKKHSTEGSFSYFVDASYGSIYPTLSRLEKEGLVTCRSETQSGKPDKKIYSITDAGRAAFVEAIASPPQPDKFKSEFLLIAMNAELLSQEKIAEMIDTRIEEISAKIEMIRAVRDDCNHPATHWVTGYGIHVKSADLEYLKANRDNLIAMAANPPARAVAAE